MEKKIKKIGVFVILAMMVQMVVSFDDEELKNMFKLKELIPGDNTHFPKAGNKVKLHYRGTFPETERRFESSYENDKPITIVVGRKMMIECWERILPKMSLGEKVYFVCPYSLAYGSQGMKGKVPPKTNLAYEVEMLDIIEEKEDKEL